MSAFRHDPEGELVLLEGSRLRARLIREGVSKNGNKWSRRVLEQLVSLVDGVPVHFYDASSAGDGSFSVHWEQLRQKLPPAIASLLPDRLPEAQVGVIRNAQIVEEDGVAALYGDVEVPEGAGWFHRVLDRFRSLGRTLGLSIHVPPDGLTSVASGAGGIEPVDVRLVRGFDVVTFPSAGGAFVPAMEGLLQEESSMNEQDKSTAAVETKESTPDAKPAGAITESEPKQNVNDGLDRIKAMEAKLVQMAQRSSNALIEAELKNAALPASIGEFAKKHLAGLIESDGTLDGDKVGAFLTELKASLGKDARPSVTEAKESGISLGTMSGDKAYAALMGLFEGQRDVKVGDETIPAFRSIKQSYVEMTGDVYCEGSSFYARRNRFRGALESFNWNGLDVFNEYRSRGGALEAAGPVGTSNYPLILADVMHKRAAKEYAQQDHAWRLVGSPETVTDFKTWRIQRVGEFANLASVSEAGTYALFDSSTGYPGEESVTLSVTKKGQLARISWEALVNDDTRRFTSFPTKIARAASRTLNKAVWDILIGNAAIYDAVALAHATHSNLTSAAPTYANLKAMRKNMVNQKDINTRESGRVRPAYVVSGSTQYDVLYELLYSPNKALLAGTVPVSTSGGATTLDNASQPSPLPGEWGIRLYEVKYFDDSADTDQYWMLADPNVTEMVAVGFLNGKQEPELFVQDLQNVGSFFDSDQLTFKVRHVWGAAAIDYRGFQGGIP